MSGVYVFLAQVFKKSLTLSSTPIKVRPVNQLKGVQDAHDQSDQQDDKQIYHRCK